MTAKVNLRAEMPKTAAFIDDMRAVFGRQGIDAQIRKGMSGLPGHFYASENGHEVGAASTPPAPGKEISAAQMVLESINPKRKEASATRR